MIVGCAEAATAVLKADSSDKAADSLRKTVREWIDNLNLYLQDEPTVRVLIPPMHSAVLERLGPLPAGLDKAGVLALLRQIEHEALP